MIILYYVTDVNKNIGYKLTIPITELVACITICGWTIINQIVDKTGEIRAEIDRAGLLAGREELIIPADCQAWIAKYGRRLRSGLICQIFRSDYKTPLNVIGQDIKDVLLVGDGVRGPFLEHPNLPVVVLDQRIICGKPHIRAIPDGVTGSMFGGNFIWTRIQDFA